MNADGKPKPDCEHCQDKVCRHDGAVWKRQCEPALAEFNERHARAAADYRDAERRAQNARDLL